MNEAKVYVSKQDSAGINFREGKRVITDYIVESESESDQDEEEEDLESDLVDLELSALSSNLGRSGR